VLGVPYELGPLARSGIVSAAGVARAALDTVLPRSRPPDDRSIADVVGRRFGHEVVDRLVEPLLGGIHAGRADRLSLESVAPEVADAARANRSVMAGLRARRQREASPAEPAPAAPPASPSPGPVFLGLRGGLGTLVDRLVDRLEGVDVRVGARVASLGDLPADRVVLTLPAFAAEPLVRPVSRRAADELAGIRYASVVTVTLAYPPAALAGPLDGSGFLVPRVDGRLLTACTWTTSKWAGAPASGDAHVLLRASAGRIDDERAMELPDDSLVEALHRELTEAMCLRRRPEASLVTRWPRSFPQYDVGHGARIERIEAALAADAPGVVAAGAAYRGLGIAACIRQAEDAAGKVVARL
jgi:oxygen-dependent protoporphyrinogen oxidase